MTTPCPVDTGRHHGPTVIPFRDPFGGEGYPNNPAAYGRYLVIDMTANNSAALDAWCERNPGQPRPDLGYGVCRHGFGLQNLGHLTEAEAIEHAERLNAETIRERKT